MVIFVHWFTLRSQNYCSSVRIPAEKNTVIPLTMHVPDAQSDTWNTCGFKVAFYLRGKLKKQSGRSHYLNILCRVA